MEDFDVQTKMNSAITTAVEEMKNKVNDAMTAAVEELRSKVNDSMNFTVTAAAEEMRIKVNDSMNSAVKAAAEELRSKVNDSKNYAVTDAVEMKRKDKLSDDVAKANCVPNPDDKTQNTSVQQNRNRSLGGKLLVLNSSLTDKIVRLLQKAIENEVPVVFDDKSLSVLVFVQKVSTTVTLTQLEKWNEKIQKEKLKYAITTYLLFVLYESSSEKNFANHLKSKNEYLLLAHYYKSHPDMEFVLDEGTKEKLTKFLWPENNI